MTQEERELEKKSFVELFQKYGHRYMSSDTLANVLLDNGAIFPPCKVGDAVFIVPEYYEKPTIFEGSVESIHLYADPEIEDEVFIIGDGAYFGFDGDYKTFSDFGKTVFITRQEAEHAMNKWKVGHEA